MSPGLIKQCPPPPPKKKLKHIRSLRNYFHRTFRVTDHTSATPDLRYLKKIFNSWLRLIRDSNTLSLKPGSARQIGHRMSFGSIHIAWIEVTTNRKHATLITGFLEVTVLKYISLMTQKFVVTHTVRQNYIPAFIDSWDTDTPSVKSLCPQKKNSPYIFVNNITWSSVRLPWDRSSLFLSAVK